MLDRATALNNLVVGDIFHAESPNGASHVCLVEAITGPTIHARTVTTQFHLEFDRSTGVALFGDRKVPCTVNSIAPLPVDIHNVMLGLDRKSRLERDPEKFKLKKEEIDALLFVGPYYALNPL